MAEESGQLSPGVLTHQEILESCGLKDNFLSETFYQGLIQPCRRENVRSASYDLRVGSEFHFTGARDHSNVLNMAVTRLKVATNEHIVIPPNQVAVISSMEKICLPEDIVGHLSLKQDILLQGLIMGSQSQIDAGYKGWIYPLLYNLTDMEVALQLGQPVIRLELVRLSQPSTRPYDGDYQLVTLAKSLKRPIGSSLTQLRSDIERRGNEIDDERQRLNRTQRWAALGAVLVFLIPIVLAYATGFISKVHDTRVDVARIEGELNGPLKLDERVGHLEARIAVLRCRLREEEKLAVPAKC